MPRPGRPIVVTPLSPQRATRVALLISLLSVCYLNYGTIRQVYLSYPDAGMEVLRGTAHAPEQYRVGVLWCAFRLSEPFSLKLRYGATVIDAVSLLVAGFLLLHVLERTAVYRRSRVEMQWLGGAAFVLLVQFYLMWVWTPQRAETLPTTLLVVLTLWLWQLKRGSLRRDCGVIASLLGVALVQSLVRADVAFFLNAGVLPVTLSPLGRRLSLRRRAAATTSVAAVLIAGGVQLYLSRVVYPQANYGYVKLWQLRPNLVHVLRWPSFVLFMGPLAWLAGQLKRRRLAVDASGMALLAGAAMYMAAWVVVGKIDEVRIFLPFAIGLTPLTVEMAMLWVGDNVVSETVRPVSSVSASGSFPSQQTE